MKTQIHTIDVLDTPSDIYSAVVSAIAYIPLATIRLDANTTKFKEITDRIGCVLPLDAFCVEWLENSDIVFNKPDGRLYSQAFIRVYLKDPEDLLIFKINFPPKGTVSNFSA